MKHIRNFLLWIPAALWYRVVWGFSTQTAAVSGDLSDRLLWLLLERVSPSFAGADTAVRSAAVELLSFFERKAAHMFLYFVLALLLWLALSGLAGRITSRAAGTALLSALLAGLDEYHQTFVPGRSGQLRDIVIDLTGAAAALLLLAVLLWVGRRRTEGRGGPAGWLPVGVCALLTASAAPVDFARLAPFAWAATRFVPAFSALDGTGQAALLTALSPILREICFLVLCGLLGCLAVLALSLTSRTFLPGAGISLVLSLLLSGLLALLWGLPAGRSAAMAALGWAAGMALWLAAVSGRRVRDARGNRVRY